MRIVDERAAHYGGEADGYANLHRIAGLWSAYLGTPVTARDVCWLMVLLKSSRSRQDGGVNPDNTLDGKGYLELAERLQ